MCSQRVGVLAKSAENNEKQALLHLAISQLPVRLVNDAETAEDRGIYHEASVQTRAVCELVARASTLERVGYSFSILCQGARQFA